MTGTTFQYALRSDALRDAPERRSSISDAVEIAAPSCRLFGKLWSIDVLTTAFTTILLPLVARLQISRCLQIPI
ncbi:MAG: hypothetical protein AAGC79_10990 [Pseudomonadota bacterium]